jgi:hypothetical protein
MMIWLVTVMMATQAAGTAMPRKVVFDGDGLETIRLDIMAMEVRLGNYVKEHSDRVVAALDRHGAKLDESGADLRRSNIAMAAALERQAVRMDMFEKILNQLVNATLFQVDVRPLIHGFEAVVKSARLEARSAADAAREAVVAANATREAVQEAVAAVPSEKAAPVPGWDDWQYWWNWWKASWHTPLSLFFLGFALYQAENRVHTVMFFVLGTFFSPYLAGVTLLLVLVRYTTACCRSTKRWVQLTPCGRYLCPRSAADVERDEELAAMGQARPGGARAGAAMAHSTMNDSTMNTTTAPVGFWAYAKSWLNPFFQYSPLGARNSFVVWYV